MNILQVGPESSGGKLLGKWMADNGIHVTRYSFPYGYGSHRGWPTEKVADWLEQNPEGPVVVTMRGTMFAARSQVAVPHVHSQERALQNIREAYVRIFRLLEDRPYYPLVYEAVVHYPETVTAGLSEYLGVTVNPPRGMYDANEKWYLEAV